MSIIRPALLLLAGLAAVCMLPVAASAKSSPGVVCSLAVTALQFGDYVPYRIGATDSTATLVVTCTTSSPTIGQVDGSIAMGGASPASDRTIGNGVHALQYQLYLDPARSRIWGNGIDQGNILPITGIVSSAAPFRQTITIYGRIPGRNMSAAAVDYAGVMTATLDY
jgi:spore coat protein U-like protein